jgi:hypothetical protein
MQLVTKVPTPAGEEIKEITPEETSEYLKQFEGKTVTVFTAKSENRKDFDLSISVEAVLERHTTKPNEFRVFVNENTYCYFDTNSIFRIANKLPALYVNSVIVIKLKNI